MCSWQYGDEMQESRHELTHNSVTATPSLSKCVTTRLLCAAFRIRVCQSDDDSYKDFPRRLKHEVEKCLLTGDMSHEHQDQRHGATRVEHLLSELRRGDFEGKNQIDGSLKDPPVGESGPRSCP